MGDAHIVNGKRRYRMWAGQPNGLAERPTDCIESVRDGGRTPLSHQCRRKRGFGINGEYCRQHAKRHPAIEQSGGENGT